MAPPSAPAPLPETVPLVTVSLPPLKMPPPDFVALFPDKVLFVTVSIPSLSQ
jgi:hypothetical protein